MVIRLQRREIGALKARIAPKLKIQNLLRREFPNPQNPNGVEYFFEVFNQSEATSVQNVTVRLIKLSPDVLQYLPVALHLKHDNPLDPRQFATEFDLGPLQIKHVDLLTGPIPSPLRRPVLIEHVVVDVKVPITLQRFRMTVEASVEMSGPTRPTLKRGWMSLTLCSVSNCRGEHGARNHHLQDTEGRQKRSLCPIHVLWRNYTTELDSKSKTRDT